MATMNGTARIGLYTCPGCKTDVYGLIVFENDIETNPVGDGTWSTPITTSIKVAGVRADFHDCIPKVTR